MAIAQWSMADEAPEAAQDNTYVARLSGETGAATSGQEAFVDEFVQEFYNGCGTFLLGRLNNVST